MRLKNKVVIVTGANSGIGKAIAQKFLEEGAFVVFSDIKGNKKKLINKKYLEQADFIKCDVSNSVEVKELIGKTLKKRKRLDVMVNNAGIYSGGSIMEESDSAWNKVINTNLNGVFYGTREAARVMKNLKIKGSIINMSSTLGNIGFQKMVAYCASKGGVEQITRVAAIELAFMGIRVNAIAPGFVKTGMLKNFLKDEKFNNMIKNEVPLGSLGNIDDVAQASVYLASNESSHMTGEILHIDGGFSIKKQNYIL